MSIDSEALRCRAASDVRGAETVLAALDSLASGPPLPPATYVDRHGAVHNLH